MIYRFEGFELNTDTYELSYKGAPVSVERQVFDVLAYLVANRERLVPKGELLDKIWRDRYVSDAALNSRVMAARKAIGDTGKEQRLIKTVHGRGYRFAGPLATADGDRAEDIAAPGTERSAAPTRSRPREQEIRFCRTSDGVRIAYATVGEGPPLVKAANWLSHLEFDWRSPVWRHWLEELSRDHMLVRYDERGCGLSDWDIPEFAFEAWVHDLETVVDELGLERFPLLGISQGGPVAITYAARHPERVSRLILYGTYPQGRKKRGMTSEELEERDALITLTRAGWGRDNPAYRQIFAATFIPGATAEQQRWFADLCRISTSPENAVQFMNTFDQIDVEDLLPRVDTPTLVLHARSDLRVPFEQGRRLAAAIRSARFVLLDGGNHILLADEPAWPLFLGEVRDFLGISSEPGAGAGVHVRTVLFTDLVGHTEMMSRLGDERGRAVLREHERITREVLKAHGGAEVKTMGDGFMASFGSVTRAVECAVALQKAVDERNRGDEPSPSTGSGRTDLEPLSIRVGLNAGEPIEEEGDLFGATVILASRIAAKAEGGEILVADTVRGLCSGKGFLFADRGEFVAKGFEEPVRVYAVRWGA